MCQDYVWQSKVKKKKKLYRDKPTNPYPYQKVTKSETKGR